MLDTYAQRREKRDEIREWILGDLGEFTHFITLSTNDTAYSEKMARAKLQEWHRRMNHHTAGRHWQKQTDRCNVWMAFAEGLKSERHWHILFHLSDDLPAYRAEAMNWGHLDDTGRFVGNRTNFKCLPCAVERRWKKIVWSGSTNVQRIYSLAGAVDYVTKELTDPNNLALFIHSSEFDQP